MKREVTRFNKYQLQAMRDNGELDALRAKDPATWTAKDRAILLFLDESPRLDKTTPGGLANIFEVRVMQEEVNGITLYTNEYQLLKSASVLKREEVQKAAQQRSDAPKQKSHKPHKKVDTKQKRKDFLMSPEGKDAAYKEALRQKKVQDARELVVEKVNKAKAGKPSHLPGGNVYRAKGKS